MAHEPFHKRQQWYVLDFNVLFSAEYHFIISMFYLLICGMLILLA
jgi:hypothetical protein